MQSDYVFLIGLNQIAMFLKLLNPGVPKASVAMLQNAEVRHFLRFVIFGKVGCFCLTLSDYWLLQLQFGYQFL